MAVAVLVDFFFKLKQGGVPVTIKEFLTLLEALRKGVVTSSLDEFYYLARVCLVKDESNFDRYDRVFAAYFKGILELPPDLLAQLPEEWLRKQAELLLSDEDKALIESLGGWEKLMETLRKRLEEQKAAIRAARNGSARRALHRTARTATTLRVYGSDKRARATGAR